MARGLFLLPVRGLGGAEVHEGVLRYDPAIRPAERAQLVLAALRTASARIRHPKRA